jgi:hypothetical protein
MTSRCCSGARAARSTLSIWDLTALRFASAGLILLPVALRRGLDPRRLGPGAIGWGLAAAMVAGAGFVYLRTGLPQTEGTLRVAGLELLLFSVLFLIVILGCARLRPIASDCV